MAAGDGPMGACDGLTRAEAELFAWLQEVRTRAGRLPARLHPGLLRAAREKAAELAATLRADHGDPWAPGPRERQAASGVRLRVMGESCSPCSPTSRACAWRGGRRPPTGRCSSYRSTVGWGSR